MLRRLAFALGTTSLLASSIAHALGLGDIKLHSRLNQPLQADIEIVALRGENVASLMAALAGHEDFEKAGIERSYALNDLRFEVAETENGAVIRVRSRGPIREPFLNFIVDLNWPAGRLQREYTVLLDPPVFADAPEPVRQTPVARPSAPASGNLQEAKVSAEPAATATGGSYVVQSADTLWRIAARARPSTDVSVHQTVTAIFRANPQAFANNNPNLIKEGATLNLPTAAEVAGVPARRALADVAGETGGVDTRRAAASAGSTGKARLSVVAPPETFQKDAAPRNAGSSREAAEVLNQENEALRGQLGQLVERTEKLEQLIKLKDQELAALKGGAAPASGATVTETPATETPATDAPVSADTTPAAPTEAAPVKKPKPVAPPPETSFVDELLSGDTPLYLGGGLLGVLLLAGGLAWQRRRANREEIVHELITPELDDTPRSVRLEEELNLPEVGEEILAPVAPVQDVATRRAELVADPLGEADIYIAYGKFEQAEQLLLGAVDAEPQRSDLRLKLLECYAEMHDEARFRDFMKQSQDLLDAQAAFARDAKALETRAFGQGGSVPSADDVFGSVAVGAGSSSEQYAPVEDHSYDAWQRPEPINTEPAPIASAGDEFSFDLHETLEPAALKPDSEPAPKDEFDFNLDSVDVPAVEQFETLDSYQEPASGGDTLGGDFDEIATKLDLARAYIEMMEVEGAREILNEVITEGNLQQRQEAEALLARI